MGVKVGDKIKLQRDDTFGAYKVGDIVSVNSLASGGVYFDDKDGDERYVCDDQFEPVAVADSNGNQHGDQPKFRVGDRVRMIKDGLSTTGAVGKLATIDSWSGALQSESGQYLLKIDPPVDYKTLAVTKEYTRATADCFELVDAPLTIRPGAFYRTRDGRKVGPMKEWAHSDAGYQWESEGYLWKDDGENYDKDSEHTIVAEWVDEPAPTPTTGFTVPLDAPEFGGAELDDDDIVEMSIGELTGAIADALRVVGKKADKPNALKRGDLVVFNRPGMITGIDKYTAHVQTDGGNYSLPLTALRAV